MCDGRGECCEHCGCCVLGVSKSYACTRMEQHAFLQQSTHACVVGAERNLGGGQHRLGHVDAKYQTRTAHTKCRCRRKAAEIVAHDVVMEDDTGEYHTRLTLRRSVENCQALSRSVAQLRGESIKEEWQEGGNAAIKSNVKSVGCDHQGATVMDKDCGLYIKQAVQEKIILMDKATAKESLADLTTKSLARQVVKEMVSPIYSVQE